MRISTRYCLISAFFLLAFNAFSFQSKIDLRINIEETGILLSDISKSTEKITLENTLRNPFESITGLVVTKEFLFLTVVSKNGSGFIHKVLQYSMSGEFVRKMGEDFSNSIQIGFDEKKNYLNIQKGRNVEIFDLSGEKIESFQTDAKRVILDDGKRIELILDYKKVWNYLVQIDGLQVFQLKDTNEPPFLMGFSPTVSRSSGSVFLSFKVDNHIYLLKDGDLEEYIELKLKGSLQNKPLFGPGIVGDWLIASALDKKRGRSVLFLVNLVNQITWQTPISVRMNGVKMGIEDDIFDTGFFIPNSSSWLNYSPTNDMIYFSTKNVSNQRSGNIQHTLFLIQLK